MLAIVAAVAIVGFGGKMERSSPAAGNAAATAAPGQCTQERQMIYVAFEAYYAQNGHPAESFDVLVGTFLREMPTNWTYTPGDPAGTITGIGACANAGTVELDGGL